MRRLKGAVMLLAAALLAAAPQSAGAWGLRRPSTDSLGYKRSWGLTAIGAETACRAGYSGRGVRIALVDCGLQGANRHVRRNVSAESGDIVPVRYAPVADTHGSWVAEPLGASLNRSGIIGVAYNATLLEIRADMDGGYKGECAFWPRDVAQGLDYAVAHKARIIVLPMQAEHPLGDAFEASLTRAVQSGAVVVIAAGNDQVGQPAYPARYAMDPRFAGSIIVAGAATFQGEIASWSDRAGAAKDHYVLAPGQWVLTDCRDKCHIASGTSFAAPFVAGAIALMMEAHPELNGREAAGRILEASRDMGPPGTDEVYGRGMLDLARAFGPAQTAATTPATANSGPAAVPATTHPSAPQGRSGALRPARGG